MAKPTVEEVRYAVTSVVLGALDELAEDERELKIQAGLWFPDADEFDRREIAAMLKVGVAGMAGLIEKRRRGMIESGRTADLGLRQQA